MFDKPVFLVLFSYQASCGFPLNGTLFAPIFLLRRGVSSPQKAILHLLSLRLRSKDMGRGLCFRPVHTYIMRRTRNLTSPVCLSQNEQIQSHSPDNPLSSTLMNPAGAPRQPSLFCRDTEISGSSSEYHVHPPFRYSLLVNPAAFVSFLFFSFFSSLSSEHGAHTYA